MSLFKLIYSKSWFVTCYKEYLLYLRPTSPSFHLLSLGNLCFTLCLGRIFFENKKKERSLWCVFYGAFRDGLGGKFSCQIKWKDCGFSLFLSTFLCSWKFAEIVCPLCLNFFTLILHLLLEMEICIKIALYAVAQFLQASRNRIVPLFVL